MSLQPDCDYEWTPGRLVAGVAIVVIASGVIGFVAHRQIQALREEASNDEAYGKFLEWARESPVPPEFNLDGLIVDADLIMLGGPAKDGIPSLIDPETVAIRDAGHLQDDDRLIGVSTGGESRAYPIRALMYHEAINDEVGGTPIAIVYCPLCDSVSVFDRRLGGKTYEFGVSGMLLNSNVLLFDRTDDALWSQLGLMAISGPNAGKSLAHLPWELTTRDAWQTTHPDSTVTTFNTGHNRDYDRAPYGDYFDSDRLLFPVTREDTRLSRKTRVVGVKLGDTIRAYSSRDIAAAPDGTVRDELPGGRVIVLQADAGSTRVVEAPRDALVVHTFWFAWAAFHPDTEIYRR